MLWIIKMCGFAQETTTSFRVTFLVFAPPEVPGNSEATLQNMSEWITLDLLKDYITTAKQTKQNPVHIFRDVQSKEQ